MRGELYHSFYFLCNKRGLSDSLYIQAIIPLSVKFVCKWPLEIIHWSPFQHLIIKLSILLRCLRASLHLFMVNCGSSATSSTVTEIYKAATGQTQRTGLHVSVKIYTEFYASGPRLCGQEQGRWHAQQSLSTCFSWILKLENNIGDVYSIELSAILVWKSLNDLWVCK